MEIRSIRFAAPRDMESTSSLAFRANPGSRGVPGLLHCQEMRIPLLNRVEREIHIRPVLAIPKCDCINPIGSGIGVAQAFNYFAPEPFLGPCLRRVAEDFLACIPNFIRHSANAFQFMIAHARWRNLLVSSMQRRLYR